MQLQKVNDVSRIIMHDHFAALTANLLGHVAFLPESTIDYRQHAMNSVGASNAGSLTYMWRRYRRGKKIFRKDLFNSMVQAGYLLELYGSSISDENTRNLIYKYSRMTEKDKLTRARFYCSRRVLKFGFIRALMQIIWG